MIGQILGHYRIIEKVGEGGMGVVYRARDERLDRDVALKVLPAGALGDEATRKRFRKEALALARLSHPNIATVHDFDSQGGVDFLVTEFIPGVTLSNKLLGGSLPEKELVHLGAQMAEGLAAAHHQGVVHRDLKPANLRVTPDGRLKILDFGLARLLAPAGGAELTQSITETRGAGTLPYMSPEQLQGEPTDERSDVYAAGTVLYEMATGQRAFREEMPSRLADAILHQPPVPPRALNGRTSPELERITLKCLEKDPERRYQTARELAVDLRTLALPASVPQSVRAMTPRRISRARAVIAAGVASILIVGILVGLDVGQWRERLFRRGAPSRIESVAVLPLENFSRDPEQDYFADGMTDELITDLAKIRGLRVISRTSVMQYRGTKKPLREIGKELNVDAVLEGSVQRSGDRVRITAQLIRADSDTHLWAESYDRELRDVLALESEVALAIAKQIQAELTPAEQAHLAASTQVDPEAYRLYLLGLHYSNKGPGEGAITSQKYFEQAIQKDPKFALAYVGLAWGHNLNTEYQLAKEPARKAMELDDSLGGAHAALAFALFSGDWDWAGAGREFQRAIELSPNNSDALHTYALYLESLGHHEEAITNMRHALELDPLSPLTNTNLGLLFADGGQYDRAILQMKAAQEIDPNFAYAHETLGAVYELQGRYQEAATEYEKVGNALGEGFLPLATAHLYASQGHKAEALRLLSQVRPTQTDLALGYPYAVAGIYARLGDRDQTFAWLEKAYREHSEGLLGLKMDPDLRSLHSDPRYQDLMRRVGLAP